MQIKILHMADVHFGRAVSGLSQNLRNIRRQEVRSTFSDAVNLAKDENVDAVKLGLSNLKVHIENLKKYNANIVVCVNKYDTDTNEEIEAVIKCCEDLAVEVAVSSAYVDGGKGAVQLAEKVIEQCNKDNNFKLLYNENETIKEKIEKVSKEIYRAGTIKYTEKAEKEMENIQKIGYDKLPICIAKTQYSISDDKDKLGAPKDYEITVKDVRLYSGAGFITVLLGDIMTMPGLSKKPALESIDITADGEIVGIF